MFKIIIFFVMILIVTVICLVCTVCCLRKESGDSIEEAEKGHNTEEEE